VAPSEPSSTSAEALFLTVIWLKSSAAKTLKSKPRVRLLPPEESVPPGGGLALDAVDAHAREGRSQAADRDVAALARVARDGDTGDALHRLGEVGVGELCDVLGLDDLDHAVVLALLDEGALERLAVAGHLDARGHGPGGGLSAAQRREGRERPARAA
jgi:hypothetical protein